VLLKIEDSLSSQVADCYELRLLINHVYRIPGWYVWPMIIFV